MSANRIRPVAGVLAGVAILVGACSTSASPSAPASQVEASASASANASAPVTPFPAAFSSTEPFAPIL